MKESLDLDRAAINGDSESARRSVAIGSDICYRLLEALTSSTLLNTILLNVCWHNSYMGQTASTPLQSSQLISQSTPLSQCPVDHQNLTNQPSVGGCPVDHNLNATKASQTGAAECPVSHSKRNILTQDEINELNQMPNLAQTPSASQKLLLSTSRVSSSIPRTVVDKTAPPESSDKAKSTVWEYPSPQQFYNALVRKGWETPEEHIDTMVKIHNFLNEAAWNEVMKWETIENQKPDVELARFRGRPGELSPKARFYMFAGWLLPTRFNGEGPFDRHDWVVRRRSTGEEVRYVIDYYSAPPEADGSPVFSLDVRPALDTIGSVGLRLRAASRDIFAAARDREKSS